MEEEYDQLLEAFGKIWETKHISEFPIRYKTCLITNAFGESIRICAVCVGKPGMVPTSIIASSMVDVFHVSYLFMTGFAAGIKYDNIKLGDIVIAKSIQDYSAGKLVSDPEDGNYKLLHELNIVNASEFLLNNANSIISDVDLMSDIYKSLAKANLLQEDNMVKAFLSPTVCGPFVVAAEQAMENIKSFADRKLQALDMEGFGLYMVGHFKRCGCLWIKGISDFADTHKGDAYHKQCAYASAKFLYYLIKENQFIV